MHLILILLVLAAVAAFLLSRQNPRDGDQSGTLSTGQTATDFEHDLAYISQGKLYLKPPSGNPGEVHSAYVQQMIDRREKSQRLHGWKQGTSFEPSFVGGRMRQEPNDALNFNFTGLAFLKDANKLLYFIQSDAFGGLFEYDIASGNELRLVHRQNLHFEDLHYDANRDRLLCATRHQNGIANLVILSRDGSEYRELTAGDSCDTSPCWVDEHRVVFQSQGLARTSDGYVVGYGPASLQLLDLRSSEIEPVLEDAGHDLLQPRVDSDGDLYYLRRPYETVDYGTSNILVDTVMFPFRLLRAVFHYLNFFSMMYSRKPLTGAGGPDTQVDAKQLMLKGMRIDTERALKRGQHVNGVPSLVPTSWQLVRRTTRGEETLLATQVAAFTIGTDNTIVYTNGNRIFVLTPKGTATVTQDQIVEEIALA